jgi:hypothetical protein
MDPMDQLRQALVVLLDDWLGRDPAVRLARTHLIAHVGETGLPLVVLAAGDEVIYLEARRMPAEFLPPLDWHRATDGTGTGLGVPIYKVGPR